MEDVKEDIREKYPSLPPNYVSLAQLQERWIQQKQKEAEQKEQIASENQQEPKEKNRFSGSPQSSKKNGVGRIHAQGVHVRRNGEQRVDANMVYVPRRQSDENHEQIRKAKSKWKSKKLGLQASGDAGMGNAKDKKDNQKKRWPRVKEGLNGEDLAQTLSGNREMSGVSIGKNGADEGYPGYEYRRVHEIVSKCTVGLAPEINGKEGNPLGFSRKPRGEQVLDGQFSSSSDSRMLDAKSRGKQVVDDQFSNSTDSQRIKAISLQKQVVEDQFLNTSESRTVEAKSCGKQVVNGQFYCSTNDRRLKANYHRNEAVNGQFLSNTGVEQIVNKVEVLPTDGFEDEASVGLRRKKNRSYNAKYGRHKRSGNDKGLLGEGNVCMQEVLQDNEEKEVSWDERRKNGKERFGSRFRQNEGRRPRGEQVVDDQFSSSSNSRTLDAKSRGKQVVDDQFSNDTDSQRVEANSLQKQVVEDQFLNTSDSRTIEVKSCGKQVVNGQFYCSTNDRRLEANDHQKEAVNGQFLSNKGVERSVNEYKVEVLPKDGSEDEASVGLRRKKNQRYKAKYGRHKRSGNDKGLLGEGNMCMQEVLQDNEQEEEKEVSWDERMKTGKERFGSRFPGNEGNGRMNRNSNERKLNLGEELVEEDVFMGKKERTGPEARTGKGARAYGNKDRVYHWLGRDFGDLSFRDSRKGNSSRGHWRSYGKFGINLHGKGKQVDGGLVWVKKEENSDTNAEISKLRKLRMVVLLLALILVDQSQSNNICPISL